MTNGNRALPKFYLRPGELMIAEEPSVITTILGSCVSITLYNQRLSAGAICHATLPSGKEEDPGRYVDQSIWLMLNHFEQLGIKRKETTVKVFGGADMFSHEQPAKSTLSIGAQNIQVAVATLRQAGYKPTVSDVGGTQGRKLFFYSHTGDVFRKWVKKEMLTY